MGLRMVLAVMDAPAGKRMVPFLPQMVPRVRPRPHRTNPFSGQATWGVRRDSPNVLAKWGACLTGEGCDSGLNPVWMPSERSVRSFGKDLLR